MVEARDGTLTSDGNCIALIVNGNGGVGRNTYQAEDFVGSSDLQLAYHSRLNQWNGLFLVACLNKSIERYNYSFSWKRTGKAFQEETVLLPATPTGEPDWVYMESTIRELMEQQERELNTLVALGETAPQQIDVSGWGEFALVDVFEMRNTNSITAASLIPDSGEVPYVTAQAGNNGVQTYVDCPTEWLNEGPCILIGGKTLSFSYQARSFCSNDSHNIALYTRDEKASSLAVQLFLISALQASLSPLFSWGDSISMRRAKGLSMTLPVTPTGEPDWAYMESMMREHIEQREKTVDVFEAFV